MSREFLRTGNIRSLRQTGAKCLKALRTHSGSVIRYTEHHHPVFLMAAHDDLSAAPAFLDAVVYGIFHQRLQNQFQDGMFKQSVIHINLIIQHIPVPNLLNGQIAGQMFQFLFDRNPVFSGGQGDAEKIRKCLRQMNDFLIIFLLRLPQNGIQRVIQKMRIHLCLQGAHLRLFEVLLFDPVLADQLLNAVCHPVHAGRQVPQFYGIRRLRPGLEMPAILAVTVLTSMDEPTLASVGVPDAPAEQVRRLATLAAEAGVTGVVASPMESAMLKEVLGDRLIVTPGVRPAGSAVGDQSRVTTPAQAFANGSTHVVIGRPITQAPDPAAAFDSIVAEID